MKYHHQVALGKLDPNVRHDIAENHKHHLCAKERLTGASSCYGDSGGPLMYKNPQTGRHFEVGIVSGSYGACSNLMAAGLYTRVTDFSDMIKDYVPSACFKSYDE